MVNAGNGFNGSLRQELQQKHVSPCLCGLLYTVVGAVPSEKSHGWGDLSHSYTTEPHPVGNPRLHPVWPGLPICLLGLPKHLSNMECVTQINILLPSTDHLTEQVQRTVKTIISPYVGSQHKHWNNHLPEFRFALNSAVRESTGVTPAELNLNWPLRRPLDIVLQPRDIVPDSLAYPKVSQLTLRCLSQEIYLWSINDRKGYDKHCCRMNLGEQDRIWLHTHSISKAENQASQLAPK